MPTPTAGERHPRDELRLHVGDAPLAAVGLDEAGHRDVVPHGVEQMHEEIGHAVAAGDRAAEALQIDEGHRGAVARREDHHFEPFPASVREGRRVAFEADDVADRSDCPRVDPIVDRVVDDRVGFPETMVGTRQSVAMGQSDRAIDRAERQNATQPERRPHPQEPLVAEVGGPPHEEPRHDVVAPPRGMPRRDGMPGALDGDVTPRVAAADHEHPLAGDRDRIGRRLVVAGMEPNACEASRDRGKPRLAVVAGGDDDPLVPRAAPAGHIDDPPWAAVACPLDPNDLAVGADEGHEAEMPGVVAEIFEALRVGRMGRPVARHPEVGILREPRGTDEPRRFEHGRRGGSEAPVAADSILPLEALGVDSEGQQVLQGGQSRRTGADDAPLSDGRLG